MNAYRDNNNGVDDDTIEPGLRSWERKAVAGLIALMITAFFAWAGVVYSGTQEVVREVRAVRAELAQQRLNEAEYRTLLERRITILEQRQSFVLSTLRRLQGEVIREED